MTFSHMNVAEFLQDLASGDPTPGGGSVAALGGALSSALCAMVARVTRGKEKYRSAWEEMETIIPEADRLRERFLELMDADAAAYRQVVAAMRMPKGTDQEKSQRSAAVSQANRKATEVPLKTAALMVEMARWLEVLIEKGNPNCVSDAGTAVQLIRAATHAAAYNVRFNLGALNDPDFVKTCSIELERTIAEIDTAALRLEKKVTAAVD